MRNTRFITFILALFTLSTLVSQGQTKDKIVPPNRFSHYVNVVWGGNTRFGPKTTNNLYLQYTLSGRQNCFDFFGYVDFPKIIGVGSEHLKGIWDKDGARAFTDLQPRVSINQLLGLGQNHNLFKEYFISGNYVGNFGPESQKRSSHVLWLGLGTSINTHSKLNLNVNIYLRKTFTDYGGLNEHSLRGYRLKVKWIYPITSLFNKQGGLSFGGFSDYDFNTGREPKDKPTNNIGSNNALQITNFLDISYKRAHLSATARYWYHGGGNKYNGGTFPVKTSGWGYYITAGVKL